MSDPLGIAGSAVGAVGGLTDGAPAAGASAGAGGKARGSGEAGNCGVVSVGFV